MTSRPWIVAPHDPIERLADNLWAVDGDVPGVPGLRRRMAIIRLADGRLVFHNAVPVDEATVKAIEALGEPKFLIVPHAHHKMDAHAFQARFGLTTVCPKVAHEVVSTVVMVDGDLSTLPADAAVRTEPIDGIKTGEHAIAVTHANGDVSLLFCDVISNVPHQRGFRGLIFRLLGFTGTGPMIISLFRRRFIADRSALRRSLERLASLPHLKRIVPSHGRNFEGDVPAALRRAAATL